MTRASRFLSPLSLVLLTALCVTVLATVQIRFLLWSHITDDAFFTFRSAENWLNGQGLTYNPGENLEAFSNPLWLFFITACRFVTGGSLIFWSHSLGLLCFLATLVLVGRMGRSWQEGVLAIILVCVMPGVQVYATLGLEVPLLMLLLVAGVSASSRASFQNPRAYGWAAVAFGLAGITRPEGILYGLLWGVSLLWSWGRQGYLTRKALVRLACLAVVTVLPTGLYTLFRLSYYHALFPNTAIAKVQGVFGIDPFWNDWIFVIVPVSAVMACWAALSSSAPMSGKIDTAPQHYWESALGPIIAGIIFCLYAGSDWMLFSRFLVPIVPLLCCGASRELLGTGASERSKAMTIGFLFFVLCGHGLIVSLPYMKNEGFAAMVMRGTDQVTMARWIAQTFPEPMRVVGRRTGAIGYYNLDDNVHDLFGLTDRSHAYYIREHGVDAAVAIDEHNPLLTPMPDLFLATLSPAREDEPRYTAPEQAYLTARFDCIKRFPQGNWGAYDVWIKKGLHPELPRRDCLR